MTEFAPTGANPRMTRAQVRRYINNMKKAQSIAKAKLELAIATGEINKDENDLKKLEDLLNTKTN